MAHIVLISTADWDHPLWTNKQHVACSLADLGHSVLYVESLGIRPANTSSKDLLRIMKRIIKGFSYPKKVYKNIWVWSPLVIPGASNTFMLSINRKIFSIGIRIILLITGLKYDWLWTYNPLIRRFLNIQGFSKIIYHAVDAIQEQPNMPKKLIEHEERKLCSLVDQVFVTSPQIKKTLEPYSPRIKYEPNCCDYNHFSKALEITHEYIPSDLFEISKPRIGFIGAVSSYKIDFNLIAEVAFLHPDWNFIFIGPTSEGEEFTDLSLMQQRKNIHFLGYKPYSQLPYYCAGIDIAWLPLHINSYTQSMFPMKFFEYLAAGLPIVSTNIDSLSSFSKQAFLCDSSVHAHSSALQAVLSGNIPLLEERLKLARNHTYESRTSRMLDLISKIN
tara:strand:- start:4874 stop:6040 length:1167 start_codon:yes stop_codon:yes gene_type:complete